MDIRRKRTNEVFESTIAALAGDGITPTPSECVWLHTLCEDVVMPDRAEVCAWLPPVVSIGRVDMYPVTVQARLWLDQYASKWWGDEELMDVLASAWALAHSNEQDAFIGMTQQLRAQIVIGAWAIGLPVTVAQLREGLKRYFGTDISIDGESPLEGRDVDPLDWGEVLARVCNSAKCQPCDVLLWTEAQLLDVLTKGKDGTTDQGTPSRSKIRALEALRIARVKITDAHKVTANG